MIGHYLADFFPGTTVLGFWHFRVTRNSELYIDEEETASLRKAVENELRNRRRGDAVRLEVEHGCPLEIRALLLENLGLTDDDLFLIDGPVNPIHLAALTEGDHSPELRYPPFVAPVAAPCAGSRAFSPPSASATNCCIIPTKTSAAWWIFSGRPPPTPRCSPSNKPSFAPAAIPRSSARSWKRCNNGKQVTAVVELDARSDEASHILWARRLEEAGVHVVYGLVGCKIHAKMCLVVRKDDDAIRRYLHLGTGNYNPAPPAFTPT